MITRRVWRSGGRVRAAVLACGAVVSLLACIAGFAWHPHLTNVSLRAGIETSVTLLALLTVGLLIAQWRATGRRPDLLLLSAVLAVALSDIVFSVVPGITGVGGVPFGFDARLVVQATVPVAFAIAAFASRARVGAGPWRVGLTAVGCLGLVAAVECVDLIAGRHGLGTGAAAWITDGVQGAEALLFIAAAVAFATRSADPGQGVLIAAAALLLAGVRVIGIAMPAIGDAWVSPRDGLRLAAYGLLCLEVAIQWSALARRRQEDAVQAERERMARDIHDGIAQDLATILLHAQRMATQYGDDHPLTVAARRAFAASRATIVDLSASQSPTTLAALRAVGDELADRFGITVTVTGEPGGAELSPRAREQTVRIAREAIVNAARHGLAGHVDVVLSGIGPRCTLQVIDDGCGLSEAVVRGATGFGLRTMRARAEELGGGLVARRRPAGGTIVELTLPADADRGR